MSVEQTSQLIQLVFNSVVMVMACVVIANGLMIRQGAIVQQLRAMQQDYGELSQSEERLSYGDRALHIKAKLRQLRRQYRLLHYSTLVAYSALLFCAGSTFVVTLRMLIGANWLITIALVLFILGLSLLLFSISLTLMDLWVSHQSLWQDISSVLASPSARSAVARLPIPRSRKPTRRTSEVAKLSVKAGLRS